MGFKLLNMLKGLLVMVVNIDSSLILFFIAKISLVSGAGLRLQQEEAWGSPKIFWAHN